MTPAEADQRINLSRHTLIQYAKMTEAGVDPMPGTLLLVHEEIGALEVIAEEHPGQTPRLVVLVSEWVSFRDRIRAKLH